jgi:type I restriction enzyme M protein
MVTGELKSKIDSLWEIFWTGGLTNPLDVIEQMTYLMFIHDLDESDNTHAKEAAMLGLPYKSIFAGEVQVGERTVDGAQLKWSVSGNRRRISTSLCGVCRMARPSM